MVEMAVQGELPVVLDLPVIVETGAMAAMPQQAQVQLLPAG